MEFTAKIYNYEDRITNLSAEAVGVVKGEKHFPVFEGNKVFKPLTKSKPFSTPLFAYAEVFWSHVINEFFMPAPKYELAFCKGYEKQIEKYNDYGTVSPMVYGEGESLLNLLQFYRKYPDPKVNIDDYINYCMIFYDYSLILGSEFFRSHRKIAEELAMQILISVLRGDQNYHYENVAFLCNKEENIVKMAPMIDHEFSSYFMFADNEKRHLFWLGKFMDSIQGTPIAEDKFAYVSTEKERKVLEASASNLHKNLVYIREYFTETTKVFLEKINCLKEALLKEPERFYLKPAVGYPDVANSDEFMIGMAKYKDCNEEKAKMYMEKYENAGKKIDFEVVSKRAVAEILTVIAMMQKILK